MEYFATMSTLEMIGLAFLIWVGLIIFIIITCVMYKYSEFLQRGAQVINDFLCPSDLDDFDPEWMDYDAWKELST